MPNLMSTGYGDGGVTTRTEGNPYTLPAPNDFFTNMVNRRYEREKPVVARPPRERVVRAAPAPSERVGPQRPAWQDELDKLKAFDQYEATLKGAATRPTGLGAQMIPGMAVDPRLLPERLKPSSSGGGQLFAPAPASAAAPSPGWPGQYSSGSAPDSGLQYMSPAERARWARLLGQG